MRLTLVQPSLRREYELREGGVSLATLRLSLFRSGARAEMEQESWRIEKDDALRPTYTVRDERLGETIAVLRPEGRRRVWEAAGRAAEWKRLGGKEGWGLVEADGSRLLAVKAKSGIARVSGTVELADGIPRREGLATALLAAYLAIRKEDESAAAAASAGAAAT